MYDSLVNFLGEFPQEVQFIIPIGFILICLLTVYGFLIAPWCEKK